MWTHTGPDSLNTLIQRGIKGGRLNKHRGVYRVEQNLSVYCQIHMAVYSPVVDNDPEIKLYCWNLFKHV